MARATKPPAPPPALHELEAVVMAEIWRRDEPATVRDVMTALNQGSTQRAYTTILTVMLRLYDKGLLSRERAGKGHRYAPTLGRDAYRDARAEAEAQALVDKFGDIALVHFAQTIEGLDRRHRQHLRDLAAGATNPSPGVAPPPEARGSS